MTFKLIIGLGNDDAQYANTYHNAGHLFVDYLAAHYPALRTHETGLRAEKTTGYMNESGAAAVRAMRRANAAPEETLIVHDESDIMLGEYKISTGRGAAGHKGVQNVFDATRANTFTRLRIGIRLKAKSGPRRKAETFVLKKISPADKKTLEHVFAQAALKLFGDPTA